MALYTQPGSVNAGIFYPRIGAIPNDSGGGRREEGIPGVEVLIQWTWCPAAADGPGGCGVGTVPTQPVAVGPALRNPNAQVSGGKALIELLCNGDAACKGTLELLSLGGAPATSGSATRVVRYGRRKYAIQPGGAVLLPVTLNRKAKRLERKNGSVQAGLVLTPASGAAATALVTLAR